MDAILEHCRRLEAAGADFIVSPCNTVHSFHAEVTDHLAIPWLHLLEVVSERLTTTLPRNTRIGVLATDGTLQTRLYDDLLERAGMIPIVPQAGSAVQDDVMQAIYHPEWGLKGSGDTIDPRATGALCRSATRLRQMGAEFIVAGCTELSTALMTEGLQDAAEWIDPLDLLAEQVLSVCYGERPLA